MKDTELLIMGGAALFLLSKRGQETIGATPQAPLERCKREFSIWQTYTTQAEKNERVAFYFRKCGYNNPNQGTWSWCMALISYCCMETGLTLKKGKQYISTGKTMDHYEQAGLLHNTPSVGDFGIMALSKKALPTHVGFVCKVVDPQTEVVFLEGNYSNSLQYVTRKRTIGKVLGYVTPVHYKG